MQVEQAVKQGNIAREDREVLLAHLLQKNRTWILAHPEYSLSPDQKTTLSKWIQRRIRGEPIAYITGEKAFYNRTFHINPSVLIPRPCTEKLIQTITKTMSVFSEEKQPQKLPKIPLSPSEKTDIVFDICTIDPDIVSITKLWSQAMPRTIVDIGTGSGCIAVTLACECPHLHIIATDISPDALEVAKENAQRHDVTHRIDFRQGNLLEPIADLPEPFLLVSNPPYIPDNEELDSDVIDYEPHEALFAGPHGTDLLSTLLVQAQKNPYCVGYIIECRSDQRQKLTI